MNAPVCESAVLNFPVKLHTAFQSVMEQNWSESASGFSQSPSGCVTGRYWSQFFGRGWNVADGGRLSASRPCGAKQSKASVTAEH